MRSSGIEPEMFAWKANSIPLTYERNYLDNASVGNRTRDSCLASR